MRIRANRGGRIANTDVRRTSVRTCQEGNTGLIPANWSFQAALGCQMYLGCSLALELVNFWDSITEVLKDPISSLIIFWGSLASPETKLERGDSSVCDLLERGSEGGGEHSRWGEGEGGVQWWVSAGAWLLPGSHLEVRRAAFCKLRKSGREVTTSWWGVFFWAEGNCQEKGKLWAVSSTTAGAWERDGHQQDPLQGPQ